MMQIYKGVVALSEFRKNKLLDQLQKVDGSIQDVSAEYVHFVDTSSELSSDDGESLRKILTYDVPFSGSRTGMHVLAVPRPGTISPWSSKATEIAINAGLKKVRRIERGVSYYIQAKSAIKRKVVADVLHDRMTEVVLASVDDGAALFTAATAKPYISVNITDGGVNSLVKANTELGLALAKDEIEYLYQAYSDLQRNPTDVELMMFGQVNSEHCRHKVFNADWIIDGKKQPKSLFGMIRNTYEKGGEDVLSAYSDNAAVLRGKVAGRFFASPATGVYGYHDEPIHSVIKVETHNHPTAIAPSPGAATGAGGEIRDEGATGRGAKPKMGLAAFNVSNLNIPGALRPWEKYYGKPDRIASALDIMLKAPIGAASFSNEFGRPGLAGYFRTYEQEMNETVWGYHKPIMLAGGLGNIRDMHVEKRTMPVGTKIIVLGGPAMLIGLGGGAASSMQAGTSTEDLDFASVQRANPEMERRVQEVIDHCWALGDSNPIITIHDVGAGGISNALPELVHDSGLGATFELRDVNRADPSLSPLEIWCNESQERYVLGVSKKDINLFTKICERENCPFAVVGVTTKEEQLVLTDRLLKNRPVDIPVAILFGKPPKMLRETTRRTPLLSELNVDAISLTDAVERVLHLPAVGSKKFLITIGDRSVGGLVVRDQMVGPWQVPISDVAVTAAGFTTNTGEALSIGERSPLALISSPASARMAIGEAITNIASADIEKLSDVKLSANWMAAVGFAGEDEKLYDAVHAVGEEFCPALGLTIPVGKDSLSMRTVWKDNKQDKNVTGPLSLVITAFSPVGNVLSTLTSQLKTDEETSLILIDLGAGNTRLGGSALAQVYNQVGDVAPDADAQLLAAFFKRLQELKRNNMLLAYHDRSDGGLFTTLVEMTFASRCGVDIDLSELSGGVLEKLFNEELGVVIQVRKKDEADVLKSLKKDLNGHVHVIGSPSSSQLVRIVNNEQLAYENSRATLEQWWSDTSYQLQRLRDNPVCADQEFADIAKADPGISPVATGALLTKKYSVKPKIAIFREQGVNGHVEMAAAFDRAQFTAVDVHLNDIISGSVILDDFVGLVACGGFSYGDVLGAGEGWAKSILLNKKLRTAFKNFFERSDTFSLGVCNGCQMLSALKELIPGATNWPAFLKNNSEQFEARLASVQIADSPSLFFKGMAGSCLPIAVAHGEGRVQFKNKADQGANLVVMQYVDNAHQITEQYPANPNGSPLGITAVTTPDGRATIMMPHPERVFMTRQLSWHPDDWDENSPWFRMFQNAREWVG